MSRCLQAVPCPLRALVFTVVSVLLGLRPAYAAEQPWPFAPASPSARAASEVFWVTLALVVVILVVVEGLIIYSSLRFRRRLALPATTPPQVTGDGKLELLWTFLPALLLVGLFWMSFDRVRGSEPSAANALRVEVTAHQFAWDFTYPDDGVKSSNEIGIPVGRPVVLEITATDVIHSLAVPELRAKLDAIPGSVNRLTVQADREGTYRGFCAELCGPGHAEMLFKVKALSANDYQVWLTTQKSGGTAGAAADPVVIERGKATFTQMGCGGCHTLAAVPGATGAVGPKLDGIGTTAATRKPGMTAEAYLRESLDQPTVFLVPGFPPAMPAIPLTDEEKAALVALLLSQR